MREVGEQGSDAAKRCILLGMREAKRQVVRSWENHHSCIGTSNYMYSGRTGGE